METRRIEAVGPVRIEAPVLVEPRPVRIGNKDMGAPLYSLRCHLIHPLPELCDAINAVVLAQWPGGPPERLRHPIQHSESGDWFAAVAPGTEPPALYHRDATTGAVVDGAHRSAIYSGAHALVTLDVSAYSIAPWANGMDLTLRGVLLLGTGERSDAGGMVAAFTEALERHIQAA